MSSEAAGGLYEGALEAYSAGRGDDARAMVAELLRRQPGHARGWLLKSVLHDEAELPVGLALVEQSIRLDPTDDQAWYNLGVFEAQRGATAAAIAAYRRAVALNPFMWSALGNGAELLRRADDFETALVWSDRQLMAQPDNWAPNLNRAISLVHMRRFAEAEAAFAAAKRDAPDRPIVDWERFSLMLFQRRFAEAWDDYEYRFAAGDLNGVFAYPFPQPLWTGQPLEGKRLLIHNEQGLGDQLMFASALAPLIREAASVTLIAAPELAPLFGASFPEVRVLPARIGRFSGDHPEPDWLNTLGPIDYQAPIGSLMAVLRRTEESFADPTPYLRPSDQARARWAGFSPGPGLKVGLCWASNPAVFRTDSARRATKKSMRLQQMSPLGVVGGCSFVSVLNWPIDDMPAALDGRLLDVSQRLTSLEETAALIEGLDLVITVDTAVAHLAGALGKKTWLLLHDFADCRWELDADRSYWYSDMTLWRQTTQGDWDGVLTRVAAALDDLAGGKS
jgi:tetratricopeptide (TPR) repeat protein